MTWILQRGLASAPLPYGTLRGNRHRGRAPLAGVALFRPLGLALRPNIHTVNAPDATRDGVTYGQVGQHGRSFPWGFGTAIVGIALEKFGELDLYHMGKQHTTRQSPPLRRRIACRRTCALSEQQL